MYNIFKPCYIAICITVIEVCEADSTTKEPDLNSSSSTICSSGESSDEDDTLPCLILPCNCVFCRFPARNERKSEPVPEAVKPPLTP